MTATAQRFRIDPEEVIHETLDGEVILIAVATGAYYSLEGSGAEIWAGLLAGRSADEVAEELEARYDAEPGAIAEAVGELVGRLVAERLALPAEDVSPSPAPPVSTNGSAPGRSAFPPPVMRKFTDMQDFLLLDPIHDVGDAGWPHTEPTP
ncbi:MAG TPA: PqqD family protein [Solirubrobacteraceae bacterium]